MIVDSVDCCMLGDGTEAGEPVDGRGSGWNDPPASQYSSTPRGSLPRKRVPYPSQSNGTPSGIAS